MFPNLPYLISMLLTMSMIIFLLFAVFVINEANKPKSYVLFVMVCICLSVWSLGAAISVSAPNLTSAIFWNQIALIGYIAIHAVGFHYVLFYISEGKLESQKWMVFLIYLPIVVVAVLMFKQLQDPNYDYSVIYTMSGWENQDNNIYINLVSITYNIGYLLIGIISFIRHVKNKTTFRIRRIVNPVILSIFVSIVFYFLCNYVFSTYLCVTPIRFGPLIALIPGYALLIELDRDKILSFTDGKHRQEVVKSDIREILYKYIAISFIGGGIFAFAFELFVNKYSFLESFLLGLTISCVGIALKIVLGLKTTVNNKDNLICIIISLFVTFLMFFILIDGGTALWPVPFLFVIAFMLYNNSRMIMGLSLSIFSSLFVISVLVPYSVVTINKVDHFFRLFITVLMTIFAIIVNRIYLSKLKEIKQQEENEKIINQVSQLFVKSSIEGFKENFDQVLALIGNHFDVERVYHFSVNDSDTHTYIYRWMRSEETPKSMDDYNVSLKTFPWWVKKLGDEGYINIYDVEKLDGNAQAEKEEIIKQGIRSTVAVPVFKQNKVIGFFGLGLENETREWDISHVITLKILSNIISDVLARNKAEVLVHEMAYKDYLTQLPNRADFYERLETVINEKCFRTFGVALLDLDGFKAVNDTYGHDGGDELLQEVAYRLKTSLRGIDSVCRFGGDEFLVLFTCIQNVKEAEKLAYRLIHLFEKPFDIYMNEMVVTTSLGLYVVEEKVDVDLIISRVDTAMYKAKGLGKNQLSIYEGLKD